MNTWDDHHLEYEIHSFGITECLPDWAWDTNRFPFSDYDLWIVLEGSGSMRTSDAVYPVSEGSCLLLRPDSGYIGEQDPGRHLVVFHVHFLAMDRQGNRIALEKFFPLFRNLCDFLFFRQLLFKMLDVCSRGRFREASHWLQVILDEIANQDRQNRLPISHPIITEIQKLCEQIQASPGRRFPLRDLAEKYGYSPDYFGRLFRKVAGMSLSDYLIRVRINQAQIYLKNSTASIESIAIQLGYEDTGFFCRQFKSRTGCSPGEYRKS